MAGEVFHAPLITAAAGLHLKSVVERHADWSKTRYPQVEVVRSLDALLADPDIDLVVIATPNTNHFPQARQAILAGKHVVVDKPFAITSAEAQELTNLAAREGVLLTIFQNRRWDGGFLTVQKVISQGLLGELVSYEAAFDRFRLQAKPDAWREKPLPGSGILYDLGAHLLDQALVLFGWPRSVTAVLRYQRPHAQTDDDFTLLLAYDRLQVALHAGMLRRQPRPHFALHGTQGSYVKFGLDPQEAALKDGCLPGSAGWGSEPEAAWGALDTGLDGLHFLGKVETLPGDYPAFYANVQAAIAHGAALAVLPEQARDVIRLLETAVQSYHEQRTIPV